MLASSIATATATVIPTMGLLPAPNARRTRGEYQRKSPLRIYFSVSPYYILFMLLWTKCGRICFCPRLYSTIFIPFCQWVSSNKNPKEGDKLSGTCAPLLIMYVVISYAVWKAYSVYGFVPSYRNRVVLIVDINEGVSIHSKCSVKIHFIIQVERICNCSNACC